MKMTTNNTKTALITGATTGFGVVIANHLIQDGYSLIILGRSKEKLNSLILDLEARNTNCHLEPFICDLSSFETIEKACNSIKQSHDRIDLLVLNAGVWNFQFIETVDKIEETLQVNVLSHVLIFKSLRQLLPSDDGAKVIFTSSGLHQGSVNFSDIEYRKTFSGFKAYRQSKLGLILLTRLFATMQENKGISFYAVHPGIVKTKLGRNAGWFSNVIFNLLGKSKEKGAKTHKHLIDHSTTDLNSGEYYSNCRITKTTEAANDLDQALKLFEAVNNYIERYYSKT